MVKRVLWTRTLSIFSQLKGGGRRRRRPIVRYGPYERSAQDIGGGGEYQERGGYRGGVGIEERGQSVPIN